MSDNVVIPNDYVDSHYSFLYNTKMNCKRDGIAKNLASLTDASELIIHGHGDVDNNKINGVSASVLAVGLTSMKFRASCRISVTGCDLGRNSRVGGTARSTATASELGTGSFAQTFQRELFRNAGLRCQVYARTSWVVVLADGRKQTVLFDANPSPSGVWSHEMGPKQPNSKIDFRIDAAGTQTMAYVY
jgi:hypothetical protein